MGKIVKCALDTRGWWIHGTMDGWMDGCRAYVCLRACLPACLPAFLPASYYRHKEPTVTVAMSFSQSKMDRARV